MLSVDVKKLLDQDTISKCKDAIMLIAEEVERLGEQKQNEFDN